jgi:type III secretory pathway component EscV
VYLDDAQKQQVQYFNSMVVTGEESNPTVDKPQHMEVLDSTSLSSDKNLDINQLVIKSQMWDSLLNTLKESSDDVVHKEMMKLIQKELHNLKKNHPTQNVSDILQLTIEENIEVRDF